MNLTNENVSFIQSSEYIPYEQRPETYIVPVVFFIIFMTGVLGNGSLVIIFLRHRALRNAPNTYIFSLALADLLLILTNVPFTSIIYTVESWPWGVLICKINESVRDISTGVSVFTLTALSVERYYAIVNPLKKLQNKPVTVISAGVIWLLASGLAIPDAISSRLIFMKVQSANEMPGEVKGAQCLVQAKARRHVARMVLIFVFLFFICFLPHHVFMLWFHLYPDAQAEYNEWWHALKIIGFCLSFLNSCVNPIALFCVSRVFRDHFKYYLCCRQPRWPKKSMSTVNRETSFGSTQKRHTQVFSMSQKRLKVEGENKIWLDSRSED